MIKAPIWKDIIYTDRTQAGVFVYYITTTEGDEEITIFNGKAWAAPNERYIDVNINRLCQDYLSTSLPDLRSITSATTEDHTEASRTFTLYDENNNILEIYKFILDWSYNDVDYENSVNMSHPINGHYCNGMLSFNTTWNGTKVSTTITPTNGDYCGDYAIYYLNRNGGWDSFLVEQKVKKTDNYEKYYINRSYNNNTIEFGKRVYHNEITTKYELHTGWISDVEASNLAFNLLSTNQAYLHNLKDNTIIPIVLTDNTAEYKSFKNNKRKMINYTINVEASQLQQNINN